MKRYTLLPKGKDVLIQQHSHQKDLNLCLPLYYCGKVIVELEKNKQGILLCLWHLYYDQVTLWSAYLFLVSINVVVVWLLISQHRWLTS